MLSQETVHQEVKIVDDQGMKEIKELYQKLDLDTEENTEKIYRGFRDYWPSSPEYSVRYCTNEDLNF